MQRTIEKLGGEFRKSLDRMATHLITATQTSNKVAWAQHHNCNLAINGKAITIVTEQWYHDCVMMHGRMLEHLYDIDSNPGTQCGTPPPEKYANVDSETLLPSTWTVPGQKKKRDFAMLGNELEQLPTKKRSRKDPILLQHLSHRDQPVVQVDREGELAKTVGLTPSHDEFDLSFRPDDCTMSTQIEHPTNSKRTQRHAFSRAESFKTTSARRLPGVHPLNSSTNKKYDKVSQSERISRSSQLFGGITFRHRISDPLQVDKLENVVKTHGGRFLANYDQEASLADFVIVKLADMTDGYANVRESQGNIVTECWIERCLFCKKLCSIEDNTLYRPFRHPMKPLAWGQSQPVLYVSVGGFDAALYPMLIRVAKALGWCFFARWHALIL